MPAKVFNDGPRRLTDRQIATRILIGALSWASVWIGVGVVAGWAIWG